MRISYFAVGILSLLTPLTAAWSKEDREIFRIRDEISAHEPDAAATFYDILGVSPSASQDDINKAYRQKSRSLHPDKIKQQLRADKAGKAKTGSSSKPAVAKPPTQAEIKRAVKDASERQARLSLIANILRGPSRDRYDHFLAHGFPLWKGTDYYYDRYRPGLGTVFAGLFVVVGGGFHYLTLYMSWKRQRDFVERYVAFARNAAWGNSAGLPGMDSVLDPVAVDDEAAAAAAAAETPMQPMNRRQRRMQEKESRKEDGRAPKKPRRTAAASSKTSSRDPSAGPAGARKRVVAENGKVLVVDSRGHVFLEEQDQDGNVGEYLLDPNELLQPTLKDTAVVRLPLWLFRASLGRFLAQQKEESEVVEVVQDDEDDSDDVPQTTPSSDSAGEDFELVDKSAEMLTKAKSTGAQQGGRTSKRKTKRR